MERMFRRPAQLEPEQAEEIVGDEDPAENSEIAHTSAWALMGVPNADFDETAVEQLKKSVRAQGVDVIASAWSRSPDFTLPGALWRIYLVWQWHQMNPDVLVERYEEGRAAMEKQGVANDQTVPSLDEVIRADEGVLAGYATEDDLPAVLGSNAALLRVLAAGVTNGPEWITDDEHVLAHRVTRRPQALLDTANELDESERQARAGTLD